MEILPSPAFFCAVKAVRAYLRLTAGYAETLPLLRLSNSLLTKRKLNDVLKTHLDSVVDYGVIRTHSFRAGLTSALARAGASDAVLQSLGRWHSTAYR